MNRRDRFLAFANFESVDRVPRAAGFVEDLRGTMTEYLGVPPGEYFDMDGGRVGGLRPPDGYAAQDYSVYHRDMLGKEGFTIDQNGCGHLGHGFYHFTQYISPLRNAQDFSELEQYPFVNNSDWLDDRLRQVVGEAHAALSRKSRRRMSAHSSQHVMNCGDSLTY